MRDRERLGDAPGWSWSTATASSASHRRKACRASTLGCCAALAVAAGWLLTRCQSSLAIAVRNPHGPLPATPPRTKRRKRRPREVGAAEPTSMRLGPKYDPRQKLSAAKLERLDELLGILDSRRTERDEFKEAVNELRQRKLLVHPMDCTKVITASARRGLVGYILGVLSDMRQQRVELNSITYGAAIAGCGKLQNFELGLELLKRMQRDGVEPTIINYNAAMDACAQCGKWEEALSLFDSLEEAGIAPTDATYSTMMKACRGGQWRLALEIKDKMSEAGERGSVITWCSLMQALEKSGQNSLAIEASKEMKRAGLQPDTIAYQVLLRSCGQVGAWSMIEELLPRFQVDETDSSDGLAEQARKDLVVAYSNGNRPGEALKLLSQVRADGADDIPPRIYVAALAACQQMQDQAMMSELLEEMKQREMAIPQEAYKSSIRLCRDVEDWTQVVRLFREVYTTMDVDEPQCYEDAITALQKLGKEDRAFLLLDEMIRTGIRPSGHVVVSIIRSASATNEMDDLLPLYRAGIEALASEEEYLQAIDLYHEVSDAEEGVRDLRLHVAALHACEMGMGRLASDAIDIFDKMKADDVSPDAEVYAVVARIQAHAGMPGGAAAVLEEAHAAGFRSEELFAVGVEVASASGDCAAARQALQQMLEAGFRPSATEYGRVMKACSDAEEWDSTLAVFSELQQARLRPDSASLDAALRAHAEAGQWEESLQLLPLIGACHDADPRVLTGCYTSAIRACEAAGEPGWTLEAYDKLRDSGLPVDDASYQMALSASWELGLKGESQELRQDWLELTYRGNDADAGVAPSRSRSRNMGKLPPAVVEIERKQRRGIAVGKDLLQAGVIACSKAGLEEQAEVLRAQLRPQGAKQKKTRRKAGRGPAQGRPTVVAQPQPQKSSTSDALPPRRGSSGGGIWDF